MGTFVAEKDYFSPNMLFEGPPGHASGRRSSADAALDAPSPRSRDGRSSRSKARQRTTTSEGFSTDYLASISSTQKLKDDHSAQSSRAFEFSAPAPIEAPRPSKSRRSASGPDLRAIGDFFLGGIGLDLAQVASSMKAPAWMQAGLSARPSPIPSESDDEDHGVWFASSPRKTSKSKSGVAPKAPEPSRERPFGAPGNSESSPPRRSASAYSLSNKDLPEWNRREQLSPNKNSASGSPPRRSSSYTNAPSPPRNPAARNLFPDSPGQTDSLSSRVRSFVGRALFVDESPERGQAQSADDWPSRRTPPPWATARQAGREYPRTPSPIPDDYDPNEQWDGPRSRRKRTATESTSPSPPPITSIPALDAILIFHATLFAAFFVAAITMYSYALTAGNSVVPAVRGTSERLIGLGRGIGRAAGAARRAGLGALVGLAGISTTPPTTPPARERGSGSETERIAWRG